MIHLVQVCRHGKEWGGDNRRIFVSGGSAGGHLATLLTLRTLQTPAIPCPHQSRPVSEELPDSNHSGRVKTSPNSSQYQSQHHHDNTLPPHADQECEFALPPDRIPALIPSVCGVVLFYPAVDVRNETNSTAVFPASCSLLGVSRGQSLLSWFFEKVVMRVRLGADSADAAQAWKAGDPFTQLREHHCNSGLGGGGGEAAGICVGCEDVAVGCPSVSGLDCNTPSCRHDHRAAKEVASFPPTLILHGELDSIVPVEHSMEWLATLAQCSSLPDTGTVGGGACGGDSGRDCRRGIRCDNGAGLGSHGSGGRLADRRRPGDALVVIPGAEHSYEIAASTLVDVTVQGVIGWLDMESNRQHRS